MPVSGGGSGGGSVKLGYGDTGENIGGGGGTGAKMLPQSRAQQLLSVAGTLLIVAYFFLSFIQLGSDPGT
jgi:hypothetical protein